MQFLCTATGVLCFRGERGGNMYGDRERGGKGREGVSRNDGGKYERERKVMEGFGSFDLLLSSSSRRCQ